MTHSDDAAEGSTVLRPADETPTVSLSSHASRQLTPGAILGDRYRIVSLLGRGGMGEVYRADDLKLGQPVALKFLSHRAGQERHMYDEVRMGRQVSHPNVCRLHDIAEVNGQLFITMEFVDGEDLASLLRRVGRLPPDRGLAISREICSGLAAAHDKGVIHRDLKPGNVMIDGRGQARITDFGLAVSQGQEGVHVSGGTPAYMAPEQLTGEPATQRSDLYALGLTLYEIFTGRRAFAASSIPDLIARQRSLDMTRPTSIVRDLDPAVERVISSCLEPDPAQRPSDAHQVIAALPGGDPLEAAVAAGETPSPEMVAAAAERGDLSPRAAWTALTLFFIALATYGMLTPRTMLYRRAPILKPPQVLEERAREILDLTGNALHRGDSTYLFLADLAQDDWMKAHPAKRHDTMPFHFLYRQSPLPMRSLNLEQRIDPENPPLSLSGMANVRVDSAGRLRELVVVPPKYEETHAPPRLVDWKPLIGLTGLRDLLDDTPRWTAPVDSDAKKAWSTNDQVRIEAASFHGRPVWLAVIYPWQQPRRMPASSRGTSSVSDFALFGGLLIAWVGAGLLGLRNLRRARVDRRGAFRVAIFVSVTCALALMLRAHHGGGLGELPIVGKAVAYALTMGTATWFGYVALEPFVRRRWPRMLIGWSRMLTGQFRDPMLGRDLLIGLITGMLVQVFRAASALAPDATPLLIPPSALGQMSATAHWVVRSAVGACVLPLAFATLFLAILLIVRNLQATMVLAALLSAAGALDMFHGPQWLRIPAALLAGVLTVAVLFRYGLLALAALTFAGLVLMRLPITFDTSAWYFGRSLIGIVILVALAVYGFIASLGGKRWLPDLAIENLSRPS